MVILFNNLRDDVWRTLSGMKVVVKKNDVKKYGLSHDICPHPKGKSLHSRLDTKVMQIQMMQGSK